jgi:hypothetical protein
MQRHALLVAAITLFWAAMNEPSPLNLGAAIVWVLTGIAVALLACAAVVLAEPALLLLIRQLARAARPRRPEGEET